MIITLILLFQAKNGKKQWLFGGRALGLQSIGRGYSRRMTFAPDNGKLNDNPNYFWTDSNPNGFAFQLEVISVGDKFTIQDANHMPLGTLEVQSLQVNILLHVISLKYFFFLCVLEFLNMNDPFFWKLRINWLVSSFIIISKTI